MVERAKYCFKHDRVVSSTQRNFRARDTVRKTVRNECSTAFFYPLHWLVTSVNLLLFEYPHGTHDMPSHVSWYPPQYSNYRR